VNYQAVVFDLGGVVMESPLHAINRFEDRHGVERGSITRLVASAGVGSAWTALETGRLPIAEFMTAFDAELARAGIHVPVRELMAAIESETVPRPAMLLAIDRLRDEGFTVAALTNNWVPFAGIDDHEVRPRFDVFVESFREGINKPDRRIYEVLLQRLAIPAKRVVYLDDIGRNLKPGRDLGMTTIKVDDPQAALQELGSLVGLNLI